MQTLLFHVDLSVILHEEHLIKRFLLIQEISKGTKIVRYFKNEDELIKIVKNIKKISYDDRLLSQNIIREKYQLKNMLNKYHNIYRLENGK